MRTKRNILAFVAAVVCCLVLISRYTSEPIQGSQKTYEIEPQITNLQYRTDAARAIDAYERIMERYMNQTERNLLSLGTDIRDVTKKMDSIDDKLAQLCQRMAGIEKALGIEKSDPKLAPEGQAAKGKSSPAVKKVPQPKSALQRLPSDGSPDDKSKKLKKD